MLISFLFNDIGDVKLPTFWFWIELTFILISCLFLTSLVTIGKKLSGKVLRGRTVVITSNGPTTKLTLEICDQLVNTHKCKVAIICKDGDIPQMSKTSVKFYKCDLKVLNDVKILVKTIQNDFGAIDLVIDQCLTDTSTNTRDFLVDEIGQHISGFLNLFVNFVPEVLQQHNPLRLIRILSNESSTKAFINTQADYNDLLKTLTDNEKNLNLSLIHLKQPNKNSIPEISLKIIRAIESNQAFVQIDDKKSFFEHFLCLRLAKIF